MKLYAALKRSPFAARVRLAVYAKGLDMEILAVPDGNARSTEFLAINPLGKVPALVLDDGTSIVEFEVIIEYLEDRFCQRPLRPVSPEGRARARMIARVCDLYLLNVSGRLWRQLSPENRNNSVVDLTFAAFDQAVGHLDGFMTTGPYAIGESLSTADCAMVPALEFLRSLAAHFDRPDVFAHHAKVADYNAFVPSNPHIARVQIEVRDGLVERLRAA